MYEMFVQACLSYYKKWLSLRFCVSLIVPPIKLYMRKLIHESSHPKLFDECFRTCKPASESLQQK